MVYFYRVTCEECGTLTPIIDGLPAAVAVDGKETPLDIIRVNTRSGNNSERIITMFEAYGVPEEQQSVPIVFLRDTYLVGFDEISAQLTEKLSGGDGLGFVFP